MDQFRLRPATFPYQPPPRLQPQNLQAPPPIIYDTAQGAVAQQPVPRTFRPVGAHNGPMLAPPLAVAPSVHQPTPQRAFCGPHPRIVFGNFQGYQNATPSTGSDSGSSRSSSGYGETPSATTFQATLNRSGLLHQTVSAAAQGYLTGIPRNPTFYLDFLRFQATVGKDNIVHTHYMLDSQFRRPFLWDIYSDPLHATYDGKQLPPSLFHEPAFHPAKDLVLIVIGLNDGGSRSTAPMLGPEIGQRLVGFPISVNPPFPEHTQAESKNQPTGGPGPMLDLGTVLNRIRQGMYMSVPDECWRAFSLREKFILAARLSTRRRDKIPCVDFLIAALELEAKHAELEHVEAVAIAVKEAHTRLDRYVFATGEDGAQRECARVVDFLGGKKMFKGLRWLGRKWIGEAFFLCVA